MSNLIPLPTPRQTFGPAEPPAPPSCSCLPTAESARRALEGKSLPRCALHRIAARDAKPATVALNDHDGLAAIVAGHVQQADERNADYLPSN